MNDVKKFQKSVRFREPLIRYKQKKQRRPTRKTVKILDLGLTDPIKEGSLSNIHVASAFERDLMSFNDPASDWILKPETRTVRQYVSAHEIESEIGEIVSNDYPFKRDDNIEI